MSSCCAGTCTPLGEQFDARAADRDLRRYRRRGPDATTRALLRLIAARRATGTVLDVGAGIGALSFELLAAGFDAATIVDAASAYLAAAEREAERRGVRDRLTLLGGDFVDVAPVVPHADVVVMDRVVCCYPAMAPLLEAACARSRHLLAVAYPNERWYVRLVIAVENLVRRLSGSTFRTFVHSGAAMRAVAARHGLHAIAETGTGVWSVALFARAAAPGRPRGS